MYKKILIVVITLVLIAVGLSGCEEQSSGTLDSRFFGTWENQIGVEVKYASNGSFWSEPLGWSGTWEVKNGKICNIHDGDSSCQEFSFSEDGNTLTVHMAGGDIIYTKKQ
jgi:hypothetical protein